MGIHDGHRERMRQRYDQMGADGFHDHEMLEMLLSCALPRVDTNPIAHELLHVYGSLHGICHAPRESLQKIPGIGPNAATLLRLIPGLCRMYYSEQETHVVLNSPEKCAAYLIPRFIGRTVETVFLLCTDSKHRLLSCILLATGNLNSAAVSSRSVVETALRFNAAHVVLAHNHPNGVALPSEEDLHTTDRLFNALAGVTVHLVDHIIVADNDYVSMADSGYFSMNASYYP